MCGCNGGQSRSYRGATSNEARPSMSVAAAAQAGAAREHEVVKSNGSPTGRKFTSLVAAARYANAIGGTIRPSR